MITNPEKAANGGVCTNCSTELVGPYCAECGQRQVDLDRPFREIGSEAMEAFLSFDTRILRTLWPLISRPGFLTVEFMAGRRARYVHPLKLYLAICVVFFVVVALSGRSMVTLSESSDTEISVGSSDATDRSDDGGESAGDEMGGADEPVPSASNGITLAESEDEDSLLARVLTPLADVAVNDPDRLNRMFSDRLAKTIIILVPVFALLLRLLYRRSSYITELIFSLHLHSFAFLALLAGMIFDLAIGASEENGPGGAAAVVAIAVYTFLSLRRVQQQGRLMTIAKMVLLLIGYVVALIITMILTLAFTALLL
jgi:hypothetical protein